MPKKSEKFETICRKAIVVREWNVYEVIADRYFEGRDHAFIAFTYPDGSRGIASDNEFAWKGK